VKAYRFKGRIEPGMGGGAAVAFPYSVEQEFGVRGNVPVKSTLDGAAYSDSLMKCGDGPHLLGVLKSIREKIGKSPGDTIDVVVWKDEAVRTVEIPAPFEALMKKKGCSPASKS
jgi:hypothetical protein